MSLSQQQLESMLWGAAEHLRGQIDASDYKQYIFPLLFYKRLSDVYQDEYEAALTFSEGDKEYAELPEQHRFVIPSLARWEKLRETTTNIGEFIQKALRNIEKTNSRLYGVFGDAQWTNKERLPDHLLASLVEHFSRIPLGINAVKQDDLGAAYEYLIKKFADDSGHTAAEFYTNRTVVHLMTRIMTLKPGESAYDPTCGTGGMLLNAVMDLRSDGKEWRTVKLYGQEVNLLTSAIARMNMFLHDIEEFDIQRGDTLAEPKFLEDDRLKTYEVIFANPPYSIKKWDRTKFSSDPFKRNEFGVPPQGCADYAFFQHIIKSLNSQTGRAAMLWPHGVLFRDSEAEIRKQIIEADLIESVIGLGPNLFYNSPMESCVVVLRRNKSKERRKKILFINGIKEVTRERAFSYLNDQNLENLVDAYFQPDKHEGIARMVDISEIRENLHNLSIPLYIRNIAKEDEQDLESTIEAWQVGRVELKKQTKKLFTALSELGFGLEDKQEEKKPESNTANIHFKRSVFAAEIVHRLHKELTFGHVKFAKMIFLTEQLCGVDTGSTYHRQVAGPYDNRALRSIDSQIKKLKWYKSKKVDTRYVYEPLEKAGQHARYYTSYFSKEADTFDRVISLFKKHGTEHCEIVATLYSAWFDFINQGISPTDDLIIDEVLNNWHESKKRIPREKWMSGLVWMRQNDITPLAKKAGGQK
ncbi:MAG: SAM-dependent DNA methyltransferase [Candidatus Margulisiibacteriota bacterium]|nr:MAG: SAM-dependent DNA methyltransferase [Candidatus Margulisiibacteriota bacterium]